MKIILFILLISMIVTEILKEEMLEDLEERVNRLEERINGSEKR